MDNVFPEKDFKSWITEKENIHYSKNVREVYFREREIWWCHLGANIGFEQDGKGESFSRPVLILKKFNKNLFWAVPLSTKLKPSPYYIHFKLPDEKVISAITLQLRIISSKRLMGRMYSLDENTFMRIKKIVKDLL